MIQHGFHLIFALAVVLSASATFAEVSYTIHDREVRVVAEGYSAQEIVVDGMTFQMLSMENGAVMSEPVGAPQFPAVPMLLPYSGNDLPQVKVHESADYQTVDTWVYPVQEVVEELAEQPPFALDAKVYARDAYYPARAVEVRGIVEVAEKRFLQVIYYPIRYNPKAGVLRVAERATIQFSESLEAAAPMATMLGAGTNGLDYVIVTPDQFYVNVLPLAIWKHQKGMRVRIVTMSDIGLSPDAAAIDAYLQNLYDTLGFSYLLIVGDVEDVPGHTYPGSCLNGETDHTSDYDYILLSGSDFLPDAAHGRLSPGHTGGGVVAADIDTVVNKLLTYEITPDLNGAWYNSFLSAGYFQDDVPAPDAYADRYFMETSMYAFEFIQKLGWNAADAWWAKYSYPSYFYRLNRTYNCRFGMPGAPVPSWVVNRWHISTDPSVATQEVSAGFNAGASLVLHRGHGYNTGSGWAQPPFTVSEVDSLTNGHMLPFVISVNSCSGRFDGNQAFAEKLLQEDNGGAIGVVACTVSPSSGATDQLVQGLFDSFWDAYDPNHTSGSPNVYPRSFRPAEALNYAKYYHYYCAGFPTQVNRILRDFHYFGDPEMHLRTQQPEGLSVYRKVVSNGSTYTARIHAYEYLQPISGLEVVLSDPSDLESEVEVDATNLAGRVDIGGLSPSVAMDLTAFDLAYDTQLMVMGHSADYIDLDWVFDLTELNRVIAFYNSGQLGVYPGTEDGYSPATSTAVTGLEHALDYNPQDWEISLSELLRAVQFHNVGGYAISLGTEDNFTPVAPVMLAMGLSGDTAPAITAHIYESAADGGTVRFNLAGAAPTATAIRIHGLSLKALSASTVAAWGADIVKENSEERCIELVWIQPPTFPLTVDVAEAMGGSASADDIKVELLYRYLGSEQRLVVEPGSLSS